MKYTLSSLIKAMAGKVSKPIDLTTTPPSVLFSLMPHISLVSHTRFTVVRLRHELVTPARAKWYLDSQWNNRKKYDDWISKLIEALANGEWTPSVVGAYVDSQDRLITGQHTMEAIIRYGKPVPMLVLTCVEHDEIAHAEGNVRAQSLADLVYRTAGISQLAQKNANVETLSALVRSGARTSSMGAKLNAKKAASFMNANLSWITSLSQGFQGSVKWVNRAAVRAAFARVYPHVRPVDWLGAIAVTHGEPKTAGSQFAVFQALQNEVVQMQGDTSQMSEAQYFFATLHAWALFIGVLKGKLVTNASLKVVSAAQLHKQLRGHNKQHQVMAGTSQLRLPQLDYTDTATQQQLLGFFPWAKAQKHGLPIP